jgi:hypothetical protein
MRGEECMRFDVVEVGAEVKNQHRTDLRERVLSNTLYIGMAVREILLLNHSVQEELERVLWIHSVQAKPETLLSIHSHENWVKAHCVYCCGHSLGFAKGCEMKKCYLSYEALLFSILPYLGQSMLEMACGMPLSWPFQMVVG